MMSSNRSGRVAGKVALVSGGARGLGASQARLLAEHGAHVMVGDVDEAGGKDLIHDLTSDGLSARFVWLDVTREEDWATAVEHTEADFGPLGILVNNAGIVRPFGFEDETLDGWEAVVRTNQLGTFLGIRSCAPALRRAGGGSIVNLASISGIIGQAGVVAYQASKGAVRQLTRAAAMQYAPDGIRVNAVCPGVIKTEMLDRASDEYKVRRTAQMPMGRFGEAIEVAYGVLFLASDESSYVTGTDLVIDGGLVAH
jgi:NAD(P)-dependent dehydrogenase (short-subunit alcohol dehydrogenase family)